MNQSPTTYQKPEEIGRMQEMKLQELLQYLNKFSPWYKKMFTQNQIDNFTEFFTFNPEGNAKLSIFFGGQGVGTGSLTASP